MFNREINHLIELLGRDNPKVEALLWWAKDPKKEGTVRNMLRSLAREAGWDPDNLPKFALPRDISASDYPVGTAMSGDVQGEEVGLADADLHSHVGVIGTTSVGKTTLVKLILLLFTKAAASGAKRTFFVWDRHGEYRDLLPLYAPNELVWLTPDDLKLNPFEVPKDAEGRPVMAAGKWINCVRELLRLLWLNEPSVNLFCEVLREEYRKRGLLDEDDEQLSIHLMSDYPSISDMIEAIKRLEVQRNSDRARAKDKLLDRLESLRELLPGLDVQRSRSFFTLFGNQSAILDVDLDEVSDIGYPVLFAFISMLFREVLRSDDPTVIERIEVIEEAHEVMGGHVDRRTADLKEGEASGVLRDLRKSKTCGVVVSQLIPDLSRSIRGNLGTVFSLRQGDGACVRQAAAALNLAPHQVAEIARLPDRYAIARFGRYGEPVYLRIKDAGPFFSGTRMLSRVEARERSRSVLESIPYVKRVEQKAAEAKDKKQTTPKPQKGLHPTERKTFARIIYRPWELTEDRLEALGLERDAESRIRTKLENRGLIALAGKAGAKFRLFEPTARGMELAAKLDLPIGKPSKGSVVHQAIIHYTRQSLEQYYSEFRFKEAGVSSTLAGVQPDLLLILPDGKRVPIQACCGNKASYEGDAFLKLHQLTQVDDGNANKVNFVIGIVVSKGRKAAIERAIRRKNDDKMPGKLTLLDFDTIVDPGLDWSRIFEDMD